MADEQNTGGNTAANKEIKTTGDVFEAAREYKQTKDALEALEKQEAQPVFVESTPQDAQEQRENNEKQRIFDDNGIEIDPETGHYIIRIDTRIDPELQAKLDPNSPQFDAQLYREHTAAAMQRLKVSLDNMRNSLLASFGEIVKPEMLQGFAETLKEIVEPLAETARAFYNSDTFKGIADTMQYIVEHSEAITERIEQWERLEPYLEKELQKPEYNGITLDELIAADADENGEPVENSLLDKAIAAAQAALDAEQLPRVTVTGKGVASVEYPLDKINANIWTLLKDAPKNGQLAFAAEKRGSSKTADILYGIDFEALEQETGVTITKKLTAFDKRCYIAASALFNGGYDIVTVAQIYAAMGNNGRPSAADIKKINDSLTKMRAAHIYLNNESEHKLYPQYSKFVYDASLLPMERISAVVNGQTVDSAIHLFREPPLVTFARDRKQITTISRQLLASPLSKTDANLQLDDYLIERISHIKKSKGKISNKLLYSKIFEKAAITTQKQRVRAKEKISKYLEHYKQCGFIKDYKEAADGVTISY